jgi:prolyl-tRNA editing enzyme YbaK/EbsC (Cys-tRNA(Pro) deacylase)
MQRPDQVVRSLLFRLSESDFVMVLVAGPAQIAWPKLRQYLGVRRITTATEQEVFQVTGYSIGAVSPFGPNMAIRILADANIFAPEEISLGSGERYTAIIINKDDLRKALGNVEIGSFV